MHTAFDPNIHGFRFRNSYPGGAVVAEITRQGRLNELVGLSFPRAVRHLAAIGQDLEFWGNFGLCGGMSWASLDRFFTDQPAPQNSNIPTRGSELFTELVTRQLDSMRGQQMIGRCLTWQLLPDTSPWWMFWTKDLLWRTGEEQWPTLRASLDAGIPVSLTLIRVAGISNPSDNHQVVAIGYDPEPSGINRIHIYDPNHPGATPTIVLESDHRGKLRHVSQSSGETLRGFFVWAYQAP